MAALYPFWLVVWTIVSAIGFIWSREWEWVLAWGGAFCVVRALLALEGMHSDIRKIRVLAELLIRSFALKEHPGVGSEPPPPPEAPK